MTLSTNMRVHLNGYIEAGLFSHQLLQLGDGKWQVDPSSGTISLPTNFCNVVKSIEDLKQTVFANIQQQFLNTGWLCERAILAPKNSSVNSINSQILSLLPGITKTYKSIDTVTDPGQAVYYPTEFLNSLEPPGIDNL